MSRVYKTYNISMQPSNPAINAYKKAYKYNAPEMCKTCAELSVYKTCNIAMLHTTEGLLTFNKETTNVKCTFKKRQHEVRVLLFGS